VKDAPDFKRVGSLFELHIAAFLIISDVVYQSGSINEVRYRSAFSECAPTCVLYEKVQPKSALKQISPRTTKVYKKE
jgi:hypothetical protein